MIVWLLTVYLGGVPVFADQHPYTTKRECRLEGWRLVAWYQQDHIQVEFDCDETQGPDRTLGEIPANQQRPGGHNQSPE
jgi:hypothetical protein